MNHVERDLVMEIPWLVIAILLVINAPALMALIAGVLIVFLLLRKVWS